MNLKHAVWYTLKEALAYRAPSAERDDPLSFSL